MITRTYFILQMNVDGEWKSLQGFTDAASAEKNLADAIVEDPEGEYRLLDRSYEIPESVTV